MIDSISANHTWKYKFMVGFYFAENTNIKKFHIFVVLFLRSCYNFFVDLTNIKGIGEARKKSFEENGIFSCEDLINYFPYKYYDFSKTEPFADDGNVRLIKATVIENPKIIKARNNLSFVSCKMNDEIGHTFSAIWFNQTFIKSQLYLGLTVFLYGKNSPKKKNTFNVSMMKQEGKFSRFGLLPIYHSIEKIGQSTISDCITKSLEMLNLSDVWPDKILSKYNILSTHDSFFKIHNPETQEDVLNAKNSIEINKLLCTLSLNDNEKIGKLERNYIYKNITMLRNEYFKLLPFELTVDQKNAIQDISDDFSNSFSMNRLLQGDVGSGKTVVAFFGAFIASFNGFQSAIIAPTEILAKQHYETATKLFGSKLKIGLLTSSTSSTDRRAILSDIESGKIQILIGTHSILSNEICFNNLSYVVFDEQHRFGVEQRASIKKRNGNIDILVMSATPIPRSLALVVYGNLDFSTINSRPKQANIQTNIVIRQKQNDMWNYIKNKLANGSKIYVVCSKIDEENENDSMIKYSAKNVYDALCKFFDESIVGLIHGKLKKQTQDRVIENFKTGKIKVLVSTTIVEVGVDIPDCDLMVIVSPERFGLATLHQLRGRIGRNGEESHCFCLADNLNEKSYERINFFKNHLNGFEIAEFDLNTRGAGTMFGTNQHGQSSDFVSNFSVDCYKTAKLIFDEIKSDGEITSKLIQKYNELNSHNDIKNIILN